MPTQFEFGFLVGLLVGEGHFGGDGRQPQVALRMHVRHEAIFRWLEQTFPGGRLYGPYHHDGRHYFQWMARGRFLQEELAPVLDRYLSPSLDRHSFDRYQLMKAHYPQLAGDREASRRGASSRSHHRHAVASPPPAAPADDAESPAESTAVTRGFTDLFAELRETWPQG